MPFAAASETTAPLPPARWPGSTPARARRERSRSLRATLCSRLRRPLISNESVTSMNSHRPGVTDFVHIGLVVEDLDETVRFLALLGFDCTSPGVFSGEWIDRIIGLENATVQYVMGRP